MDETGTKTNPPTQGVVDSSVVYKQVNVDTPHVAVNQSPTNQGVIKNWLTDSLPSTTTNSTVEDGASNPTSKLEELCEQLQLPERISSMASSLWEAVQKTGIEDSDSLVWCTSCIYIATVDCRLPYGLGDPQANDQLHLPAVTVSELLMAAQVSIVEFFKKLMVLKQHVELSDAVRHYLLGLERKYLITCPLFNKFEKIFQDVFQKIEHGTPLMVVGDDEPKEFIERKKFTWTLFLFAKSQVADDNPELILSFHLLLCCINYVMRMTPGFQLKAPFDTLHVSSGENDCDLEMLKELCEIYKSNFDEVKIVQADCFNPIIERLPQNNSSIDVLALENNYHNQYKSLGDINEMLFLEYEPHLVLKRREPNNNSNGSTVSGENVPVLTPVRAALTSVHHLRSLLSEASDEGSETLHSYFQKCAINPHPFITRLLEELQPKFIESYTTVMGQNNRNVGEMRFKMAVRLYYRVMETLLKQEEDRLSNSSFSQLLHNRTSHMCLLACAVEVVMVVYGNNKLNTPSMRIQGIHLLKNELTNPTLFPWILRTFDIQGFDFFIVLENFVQAEPKLAKEAIRHLQNVEVTLLESAAWQPGSPVYEALSHCEVLGLSGAMSENLQNTKGGIVQSVKVMSPKPSSVNSPRMPRSQGLRQFLNKACRLAYKRLQVLCDNLKVAKDTQLKIWSCMEYCITQRPDLLKRRHLDQILMCCVYAVCRVVEQNITFKNIVGVYKEMPHAEQATYKQVLLMGEDYDSIISFYNKVFTQHLKSYILQFDSSRQPNTLSPAPKTTPSLTASPIYHLPGHRNFYISPMKGGNQFKMPQSPSQMTPRTRQLISIGEGFGSTEKFRHINDCMKQARVSLSNKPGGSKSSKRLAFDQMDDSALNEADSTPMMLTKRSKPGANKSLPFSYSSTTKLKGEKES